MKLERPGVAPGLLFEAPSSFLRGAAVREPVEGEGGPGLIIGAQRGVGIG